MNTPTMVLPYLALSLDVRSVWRLTLYLLVLPPPLGCVCNIGTSFVRPRRLSMEKNSELERTLAQELLGIGRRADRFIGEEEEDREVVPAHTFTGDEIIWEVFLFPPMAAFCSCFLFYMLCTY